MSANALQFVGGVALDVAVPIIAEAVALEEAP
jgi:hypothetical protein